jgi:Asp-tRNA(Asn)/Glu-tRNA(Gln) amidotransferase A subunit family amidase
MTDLFRLSAADTLRAVRAGRASAEDVARSCLERIEERNQEIHAFEHLLPADQILARVRENHMTGRLSGLLIGVKDIIDTADLPTELGTPVHRGNRPRADAACVALLRRAGGVIAGKTASTELAFLHPAGTRNPHHPEHTPGGSSSGSAAAIADYMVPIALGSQTAGSLIKPAAYCGVVGYVATRGELPLRGVQPLSPCFDALGVLCRQVEDVQLARSALLDAELRPVPCSPQPIALVLPTGVPIDPDMLAATRAAATLLADAGADVEPIEISSEIAALTEHHSAVMAFEVARTLAYETDFKDQLSRPLLDLIELGNSTSYESYLHALASLQVIERSLADALAGARVVLTPAATGPAPHGLSSTGSSDMNRPWQALGRPSVALPAGRTSEGLPLGVQLVGAKHDDDALLAVARWAERQLLPQAVGERLHR